jgi:hypothetical protein
MIHSLANHQGGQCTLSSSTLAVCTKETYQMIISQAWSRQWGARAWHALFLALGLAVLSLPSRVEADFIQDFSGDTAPTGGMVTSTVNFAVLNTTGGKAGDTWGTQYAKFDTTFTPGSGSPMASADTSAKYLYLYQVTNDSPGVGEPNIIPRVRLNLGVAVKDITSWGWWPGLGLSDAGGAITSGNFFGTSRARGNPAAHNAGVTSPSVVALTRGTYVDSSDILAASLDGASLYSYWGLHGDPDLISQQRSGIYGFTTNAAPGFLPVKVFPEGIIVTPAQGSAPSPVPEPATALLFGAGILPLLFHHARRVHGRRDDA